MRPVTDSFLATIRGAHKAVFRARIVDPGLTGVNPGPLNPDGSPVNEIPIFGGDVTFSTKDDVNATLDLLTSYNWPTFTDDIGTPYGQEVFVERGVQYGNGTREFVGLGYFRIDVVEQDNAPKGAIRISGSDRMANVRDGRPIAPVQFSASASVGQVLDYVVGEVVPGLVSVYDFDAYGTAIGSDHILDDDRMKFVQELVAAYGKVAYFDYAGRFVVKDIPSNQKAPVFTINHGLNGVLVSLKRSLTRDGVYNGVVASGEPVGELPPVRGVALDLNPESVTYWNGPFGKVPRFFSSSFMTTSAQCVKAAQGLLAGAVGLPYVVNLGLVPNPALEGWDVVKVTYSDKEDPETHIIDTITYSLSVDGSMGIDTRRQYINGGS